MKNLKIMADFFFISVKAIIKGVTNDLSIITRLAELNLQITVTWMSWREDTFCNKTYCSLIYFEGHVDLYKENLTLNSPCQFSVTLETLLLWIK